MPDFVDLHIHTDHSDGRQSPQEAVDRALQLRLKAIAITDHDAVSGYEQAAAYADGKDIEVISGVELSAAKADDDIHILGYMIRPDDDRLQETLNRFRRIRTERAKKMIDKLRKLGIEVEFDEVAAVADGAPLGRPHLAQVLIERKAVSSYNRAFEKYLALDGPVYVPKAKLTPGEAIDLIHHAGGLAVMAHPQLTDRDEMIPELVHSGLDGLEIFHPTHSGRTRKRYRQIAKRHRLIMTGGSDSHKRAGRYGEIGSEHVPSQYLTQLKACHRRLFES